MGFDTDRMRALHRGVHPAMLCLLEEVQWEGAPRSDNPTWSLLHWGRCFQRFTGSTPFHLSYTPFMWTCTADLYALWVWCYIGLILNFIWKSDRSSQCGSLLMWLRYNFPLRLQVCQGGKSCKEICLNPFWGAVKQLFTLLAKTAAWLMGRQCQAVGWLIGQSVQHSLEMFVFLFLRESV